MARIVEIALSAWTLVWAFSFWVRTERLRNWLGIWVEEPPPGHSGEVDRLDYGGLGGWVNCPQCMAFLAIVPAALVARCFPFLSQALAGLGLAQLVVRWWEGARTKVRWWE
jgi:hypothetical protein